MLKSKTTNQLFLLAFSIALLDISILYVNEAGMILLNQAMLVQLAVSFVFGFFHAQKILKLTKSVVDLSFVLKTVYMSFIYTAWYNVIFLPLSGLGIMEWLLFALVIFSDFLFGVSNRKNKSIAYINSSDVTLMIFGTIMFLVKWIIYYAFPDNIYTQSFVGNPTARFLVLVFCIIGLIFMFSFLIKSVKAKISVQEKTKSVVEKGLKKIGKVISGFFKLIFSMLSGPALIIVLFCALLVFGIVIFAEASAISDDILNFVEPILARLFSTGKASVVPSVIYFIFQIIVLASVLIFYALYRNSFENEAKQKIEKILYENINALPNTFSSKDKETLYKKKTDEIENEKHFVRILNDPEQLKIFTSAQTDAQDGE